MTIWSVVDDCRCCHDRDHYVTQVVWRDASHVTVEWAIRLQTETFTYIYDVSTGDSVQVHAHTYS